jgi:diguanylate cyclase (GGDEF)-like protein/PAS domain S-box-containing protein
MEERHDRPPRLPQALDDILDRITEAFVAFDRDYRYVYVNRQAAVLLGREAGELLGRRVWDVFPEDRWLVFREACELALREQRYQELEEALGERWFAVRIYPSPEGLSVFFQELTELKATERELARNEQRYRVLVHAVSSVVWTADGRGRGLVSESWTELTGRTLHGGIDAGWAEAVHPEDRERVEALWAGALATGERFDGSYRVAATDGDWRHVRVRGVPVVEGGEVVQWVGVIDDVTEQVRADEALRRAALEDALTGLPNRAHFLDRVVADLERRARPPAALLYVDIDRFKAVNDAYGHAGGDALLRAVARRLNAGIRAGDVASRLSGDEFAVWLADLEDREQGVAVARRLAEAIGDPTQDDGLRAEASIGVAFPGPDDDDPEKLLREADAAMYQVKARGGGGVEVFDQDLRRRLRRRTTIEEELRAGLEDGGLDLHYQPVVSFRPGWASTAEALLRWRARDGTVLPAPDVISVAEQTGLILPIGAEVLMRACRQGAAWSADGHEPIALSVNISVTQLDRPADLLAQVDAALAASGLSPGLLWLEITESMLMEHQERTRSLLETLRELGVKIALDDFGVGYSSLSYLHRLPVDAVQVDRSFIAGLPGDAGSARIVEAVVGLGRAFHTGIVAEGVETPEQLAAIRAAGCSGVQGYALARPVPAEGLPDALARAVDLARA